MWKRLSVILLVTAFLASTTAAYAASQELIGGMAYKLRRGLINTCTGWVEFPAQIIKGYNEGFMGSGDNKILGATVGIFEGICHSTGRTLSGLIELFGFWAANPEDNENVGIPLDAEYAWEEGEPYDGFDPSFTNATLVPMGNKFLRGAGNALFGFLELPGQMLKGFSEGAYDLGIVRGLWYWYSREVHGLSDMATALLPNPKDYKGVAYDNEWPWEVLLEGM